MEHDHHHHHHDHHHGSDRRLFLALLLTAVFAVIEAGGGMWAGSLALLSDAGHMATDVAALGLALFAQAVSRRPASARNSYGYARAEVLGALVNSLLMLAIVGWIAFEAIGRLLHPQHVNGLAVLAIASAGLVTNIVSACLLSGDSHNMNSRAALMHVLSDLLGSAAAMIAGLVIYLTGWMPIDPLLSFVVTFLILRSTWKLVLRSSHMLMEGVPSHLDLSAVGNSLARQTGVQSVHDLHVWHLGSQRIALSAHMVITDADRWPRLLAASQTMLAKDYGIDHVTLQPAWAVAPPKGKVIPVTPVAGDSAQDTHHHDHDRNCDHDDHAGRHHRH